MVYYSLKPTTISKEIVAENIGKEIYVEKHEKFTPTIVEMPIQTLAESGEITISPNIEVVLPTEGGYFATSNKNINIRKRNSTTVIFSIPFGVNNVVIETKEKGDIVSRTYRVV